MFECPMSSFSVARSTSAIADRVTSAERSAGEILSPRLGSGRTRPKTMPAKEPVLEVALLLERRKDVAVPGRVLVEHRGLCPRPNDARLEVLHGHAHVRPAGPDGELVVRDRVARSGGPARLIPRRVRSEDQNVVGICGGQTGAGRGRDRGPARVVHRAIEYA